MTTEGAGSAVRPFRQATSFDVAPQRKFYTPETRIMRNSGPDRKRGCGWCWTLKLEGFLKSASARVESGHGPDQCRSWWKRFIESKFALVIAAILEFLQGGGR